MYDNCSHSMPFAPTALTQEGEDNQLGEPLFHSVDLSHLPFPLLVPLCGPNQDAVQPYPLQSHRHEDMSIERPEVGDNHHITGHASSEGSRNSPSRAKPQSRNRAHNMIEKRYRTNLNEKIAELRDAVPDLRAATAHSSSPEYGSHDGMMTHRN